MPKPSSFLLASALVLTMHDAPALAQSQVDRVDPLIAQEARPAPVDEPPPAADDVAINSDVAVSPGPLANEVQIGAVRFDGLSKVSAAQLMPAVEPFLGGPLSVQRQRDLVAAVVDRLRGLGFPLATAAIPAQRVANGVLLVRVDEGRIAGLRFAGDRHRLAERMLDVLASGDPVTTHRLERSIRLAEAIPGVQVRRTTLVQEGGLNVLVVTLRVVRHYASLAVDNWGTDTLGPAQAHGRYEQRGVLASGDELTVVGTVTPPELSEYNYISARYSTPIGDDGLRIGALASVSRTDAGDRLRGRDFSGTGVRAAAAVDYPLLLRREATIRLSASLAMRDSETRRAGRPIRDDRSPLLTADIGGWLRGGFGTVSGGVALVHGPGWFDATREGDPLASRRDGDARFTKIEMRAALVTPVAGPVSIAIDAEAQFASRPLLSGDEFGIGGARFGRGYDYREAAGDNAVAGAVEVRFDLAKPPLQLRSVQLYAYGDAAHVRDLRRDDAVDSLYTAGGGVRIDLDRKIGFSVEIGQALDRKRDPRLSVSGSVRF